jgi:H/ACA ribonucleoprotein complex non-core subunit NAF1
LKINASLFGQKMLSPDFIHTVIEKLWSPKNHFKLKVYCLCVCSDASWKDDEEAPPEFLEYSDDEEERAAKKNRTIEKMVQRGATEEEVAAKRAKLSEPRRGNRGGRGQRGAAARGGAHRDWSEERNDGNMAYNNQRFDNGLYARSTNPFYRQGRQYNPRDQGQIQWNNYHVLAPPGPPPPQPGYFTAGYGRGGGGQQQRPNGPSHHSYGQQGHHQFSHFSMPPPPMRAHNPWSYPPPPPPHR